MYIITPKLQWDLATINSSFMRYWYSGRSFQYLSYLYKLPLPDSLCFPVTRCASSHDDSIASHAVHLIFFLPFPFDLHKPLTAIT